MFWLCNVILEESFFNLFFYFCVCACAKSTLSWRKFDSWIWNWALDLWKTWVQYPKGSIFLDGRDGCPFDSILCKLFFSFMFVVVFMSFAESLDVSNLNWTETFYEFIVIFTILDTSYVFYILVNKRNIHE